MNEWDVLQAPKINFSREGKKKNYFNCRVFQCCPTTGNCGFVTSLHTSNSHPKSFSVQVATSNTSNTKKSGNVYIIRQGKITDSTHSLAAFIKQNLSRFSTFFTHLKQCCSVRVNEGYGMRATGNRNEALHNRTLHR